MKGAGGHWEELQEKEPVIPAFLRATPETFLQTRAPASGVTPKVDKAEPNPKTLTGRRKVPILSVVPSTSIIAEAVAMQYGAFEAPRVDGQKGYGPYNFRDQAIEAMTYVDATLRHVQAWVDGEDCADDSLIHHLWHAKASLGILIDAIERKSVVDNRPPKGVAAAMLARFKKETGK